MEYQNHRECAVGDRATATRLAGETNVHSPFERLLFSLLPTLVLIFLSPFYLRHYYSQPVHVLPGPLLRAKLAAAAGLATVEYFNFRILHSTGASTASAASCIAAICIGFVVNAEHRRALQSSALTGVYLLITLLFDVARAKSYLDKPPMHMLASLAVAGAVLKLCLLLLLEVSKRGLIADPRVRDSISEESVSGFWSRSFLVWLHATLFLGFRTIISIDNLDRLDSEFSSQTLSTRLELRMRKARPSRFCLIKALMCTFYVEFLFVALPRLSLIGFTFYYPFYLQKVITYVAQDGSSILLSMGLIGLSAFIFLGIAASRSIYNHMNSRLVTMVRGALIPLIVKKTLALPHAEAQESAALTLMSTDVEGITTGLPGLHELWANSTEIAMGLYLLNTMATEAVRAVLTTIVLAALLAFGVGIAVSRYTVAWNERIEKRVSHTTKVLSQIKSIKMIGIERAIASRIQSLRVSEVSAYKKVRFVAALMNFISVSSFAGMNVAAIAKGLLGDSFTGTLVSARAFTTLAIVTLTGYPLSEVLLKHTRLRLTWACIERVQRHLLLQETQAAEATPNSPLLGYNGLEKSAEPQTEGRLFEFNSAYLAATPRAEPVLNNVVCSMDQSQVTAIIGPVGSGKTTVIRAILGEAAIQHGQVLRKDCKIAYCGQKPWLRNASIRSNIIGPASFDPVWYEVAINTSALSHDIQQLPGRDLTIVGSNGANLSGGQRHRIALARALYSRAPVLLLDDIFSGLDDSTAQDIHNRLFGPKGVVRKSKTTVVFTTHSASFIKSAHQALILDGNGTVTVEPDPSKLVLPTDLAARLGPSEEATEVPSATAASSQAESLLRPPELGQDDDIRRRGDRRLYQFFLGPTKPWKIVLLLIGIFVAVANEGFGDIFVRVWLEMDASNIEYFNIYVAIQVMSGLITLGSLCYWFLALAPQNSLKLHKLLLDSVINAKLSYITTIDIGSLLNRFGQDMAILTDDLPKALYSFIYLAIQVLLCTCIVLSGIRYSILAMPFLIIILCSVPVYSLRTSRQIRHLNTEATIPLYTLATEIAFGLEHIRAFAWQSQVFAEGIEALDYSQKPYYYKLAIQRWVELAMDLANFGLVIILVFVATITKEITSPAATGLSLLSLATFNIKLNLAIAACVRLETAVACVARLRAFVQGTPTERGDIHASLAPRWPQHGNITISNVTVQYSPNESTPVLNDVSLKIRGGQKVGVSGRSGSGKTSMLLTLLRLTEYTGRIVIDGVDISSVPPHQLRSRITTVSQDTIKINGTIRENLLPYEGQLSDETITDDIIFEALDQTDLTDVINSRGGINVPLSGMDLSEGQMQLLCLARAIIHNTCTQSKVVLLDEPTSCLDLETDSKMQATIRDVFLDCTILMVSHRSESLWDSNVRFEVRDKGVVRLAASQKSQQNW